MMDALQQLLDRQLVDRDGLLVGKVDDVELEELEDGRLVVSALLLGGGALGPRLGGGWGSVVVRVWARLTGRSPQDAHRIGFEQVASVDTAVRLGVGKDSLDLGALEDWVRTRIIDALPGAGTEPS